MRGFSVFRPLKPVVPRLVGTTALPPALVINRYSCEGLAIREENTLEDSPRMNLKSLLP
jgi:hypothetical protein